MAMITEAKVSNCPKCGMLSHTIADDYRCAGGGYSLTWIMCGHAKECLPNGEEYVPVEESAKSEEDNVGEAHIYRNQKKLPKELVGTKLELVCFERGMARGLVLKRPDEWDHRFTIAAYHVPVKRSLGRRRIWWVETTPTIPDEWSAAQMARLREWVREQLSAVLGTYFVKGSSWDFMEWGDLQRHAKVGG